MVICRKYYIIFNVKIKKVKGFGGSGFEYFCAGIVAACESPRTFLYLASEERVDAVSGNIESYLRLKKATATPLVYPADDELKRLRALENLFQTSDLQNRFVISSPAALEKKTLEKNDFKRLSKTIKKGSEVSSLTEYLSAAGFVRVDFVENFCEYAVRGEITDIWPPSCENPLRLVFDGNTVEEIKAFNPATQTSCAAVAELFLSPVKESGDSGLLEWLGGKPLVFVDSSVHFESIPKSVFSAAEKIWLNDPLSADSEDAGFLRGSFYGGNIRLFCEDIKNLSRYKKIVFYRNAGEFKRFTELVGSYAEFSYFAGEVDEGFVNHGEKLFVISAAQFFLKNYSTRPKEIKVPPKRTEGLWEMESGDYVVHDDYGIGRYNGIRLLDEPPQEFVEIEYKFGDKLFVPMVDFGKIKKYIGVEGIKPRLSDLDAPYRWAKTKQKASRSAEAFAKELLNLYAVREKLSAPAMSGETTWEKELEESFPYEETPDQSAAIRDVASDLSQPHPMDRLVLGDVGFGKTEVALRAAFKSAVNSYQTAVIVPTTILAMQHYSRFTERLAPFPIKVAVLHRFISKSEQKKIIADINAGRADIVIGTHRLLSKDVVFKNLGLLIIDEEHRFGVRQKEKIRHMKKNVHTLFMSATPIPRTLSAALNGIKDLSLIETPPIGRQSIETVIDCFSVERVKSAIYNELARGGQIFYVHNKIENLEKKVAFLKSVAPGAQLDMIHGRMSARKIENVLVDFYKGKIDCLVATTIVESGIDIPMVNTIIIDGAEDFGLAQLYQLRGRAGREKQKAYCYLLYGSKVLSNDARKRLEALRELSALGSGYKLARRDLEIRGAGALFGYRQHGFLSAVGFDLYTKMVADAVKNMRLSGLPPARADIVSPSLEISYPAFIPRDYIEQDTVRISFYRRFISVLTTAEIDEILAELKDRFGNVPDSVLKVAALAAFKIFLQENRISEVRDVSDGFTVAFREGVSFDSTGLKNMLDQMGQFIQFLPDNKIKIRKLPGDEDKIVFLRKMLEKILKFATISQ